MREALISIIVPIYKVEQYLDRCIESIVNQTYKNLEIILVDDGSPDNCPQICNEWKEKDNRIVVIHKENGGLSDARNAGLDIAQGEYIAFVDSDDYMSIYMIEKLYNSLIETQAEICECNYKLFFDDDFIGDNLLEGKIEKYSKKEAIKLLFSETKFKHVVWNKLYKKEVLTNLNFEEGKLHEDLFYTYQTFENSENITKINEELYFYRQRNDSIMGTQFSLNNLNALEARKNQLDFVRDRYPELTILLENRLLGSCLYFMQLSLCTKDQKLIKNTKKIINPLFNETNKNRRKKNISKQEIWYKLASVSLIGCCKIRNKLKIGL